MRPGKLLALLFLFAAGCLAPITKRLDTTNGQLAQTNQHLAAINEKMREANARMIDMNQHLVATNEQLRETNRRLEAIENRLPRLPRLGLNDPAQLPLTQRPQSGG